MDHQPPSTTSPTRRAAARRHWPLRKTTLAGQDQDDNPRSLAPEERLGMMWRLAVDAWLLSGRSLPDYPRAAIPGRVIRPMTTTPPGPAGEREPQ